MICIMYLDTTVILFNNVLYIETLELPLDCFSTLRYFLEALNIIYCSKSFSVRFGIRAKILDYLYGLV